jgi:hypothetical protein
METVKDLFESLKNRFRNPFLLSFLISWIVTNYKLIILFFYTPQYYAIKNNFESYFKLIEENIDNEKSIVIPFIAALSYTIFFPIFNNLIKAFNSWNAMWGENWSLKILKNGSIPINKYLNLKKEYEKKISTIENLVETEFQSLEKNASLIDENIQLKNDLNNSLDDLNNYKIKISKINNFTMLNGFWINTYRENPNSELRSEEIKIENGKYFIVEEFGTLKHVFNIYDFYYVDFYETPKIHFVKVGVIQGDEFNLKRRIPNNLQMNDENTLVGLEDYHIDIQYKRKK